MRKNATGSVTGTASGIKAQEYAARTDIRIGSYIEFGHYPQTKSGNDSTPIEWRVLSRDGDKALLISRYALDCKLYNKDRVAVTWETCTLRSWLNNVFLHRAFTSAERAAIKPTTVNNSQSQGNPKWNTNGGNNTRDIVFLLSYQEASKYFTGDKARKCAPTYYAIKNNAYADNDYKVDGRSTCLCWLRSPGPSATWAASVSNDGGLGYGTDVKNDYYGVRPALWVDLETMFKENTTVSRIGKESFTKAQENMAKSAIRIGSCIKFGRYPQTESGNDSTPIEWIVLTRSGEKALLISRYALDCKPYKEDVLTTWKSCTLRSWLNNEFLNKAFTSTEQAAIKTTLIDNSQSEGNPKFDDDDNNFVNKTRDKMFLLSYQEASKYFADDEARQCAPTNFTIETGAYTDDFYAIDGRHTCVWWLRSPGCLATFAEAVGPDGGLGYRGNVSRDDTAVRPALWVDLKSGNL